MAGLVTSRAHTNTFQRVLAVLTACLVLFSLPRQADAVDAWSYPNPGVKHLHRTTPAPAEFHAIVIDLSEPGVKVVCTPPNKRWKVTSEYASQNGLAVAINGGFWGLMGQGAEGLAAGNGVVWASDDEDHGFFAMIRNGTAMVSPTSSVVEASRYGVTDAVSGRPMIVERGRLSEELYGFGPRAYTREPRTAIGVSQDGKKVFFATVDGRRSTSHGSTLREMGELMIELGAWRALNLDGGGSTTMYVANEGGVVNRPSRGWEREVINHVGVIAPAPPPPPAPAHSDTPAAVAPAPVAPRVDIVETPKAVLDRAEVERATQANDEAEDYEGTGWRNWIRARLQKYFAIDRLRLGKYREIVVPAFLILTALIFGLITYFVGRKIVRIVRRVRAKNAASRTATARSATTPAAEPAAEPGTTPSTQP